VKVAEEKEGVAEIAERLPTLCVSWRTKGQQLLVHANRLFESAFQMRRIPVCPKCVCLLLQPFSVLIAMISSHEFGMSRKGRLTRTCPVATLQALRQNSEPSARSGTSWVDWNSCRGRCDKGGGNTAHAVQWDEKREGRTRSFAADYDYVHEP
jgi:hypothetical protein